MQPGYNTADAYSMGSSCRYTDDWEGHLPREPSRREDCSGLTYSGMMTTEVSHNVLTIFVISN